MKTTLRIAAPLLAAFVLFACTPPTPTTTTQHPNTGTPVGPADGPSSGNSVDFAYGPNDFAQGSIDFGKVGDSPDLGKITTGGTGGGACGSVTDSGTCSGNTLTYCDDTMVLQTVDCTANGGCVVDATGFADCAK